MHTTAVMLSEAKHLSAQRDRSFAELTLSKANVLRACQEPHLLLVQRRVSEWGDTVRHLRLMLIGNPTYSPTHLRYCKCQACGKLSSA